MVRRKNNTSINYTAVLIIVLLTGLIVGGVYLGRYFDSTEVVIIIEDDDGGGDTTIITDHETYEYTYTKLFLDSNNYNYNTSTIEVDSGAKLKKILPVNSTFYADYEENINATLGIGNLTGIPNNGLNIVDERLNLTGGAVNYIDYNATDNADSAQIGSIKFQFELNYAGAPPAKRTLFSIAKSHNDDTNLIELSRQVSSQVEIIINDENGDNLISGAMGIWNPTLDVEYCCELNYDLTNGATRFFINGTQFGSTHTETGTRSNDVGLIRIASDYTGTDTFNGWIDEFTIYNYTQHITDFDFVEEKLYSQNNDSIIPLSGISADIHSWVSFTETASINEGAGIGYLLTVNGGISWFYHTGTTFSVSDGTYAQSSNASLINSVFQLVATASNTLEFKAILHSTNGTSTPILSKIEIEYLAHE
jgi:hypothetical protein